MFFVLFVKLTQSITRLYSTFRQGQATLVLVSPRKVRAQGPCQVLQKKRLAPEEPLFGLPLRENFVVSESTQQHLKKQKRKREASTKNSSTPREDVIDLVDDSD
jgi:hypothetical protein